jgi:hypothetical protein
MPVIVVRVAATVPAGMTPAANQATHSRTTEFWVQQLLRDGFCIIRDAASVPLIERLNESLDERFSKTPFCDGGFYGRRTKRFGSLLNHSMAVADLVRHPLGLGNGSAVRARMKAKKERSHPRSWAGCMHHGFLLRIPISWPHQTVGGFAFAVSPSQPASQARLIWDARFDSSVIPVEAMPASPRDADTFDPSRFWSLTTIVVHPAEGEHVVFSDGYRRIRIDVTCGTLSEDPVHLRYRLSGLAGAEAKVLTLRRLLALCRLGRFARNLHAPEHLAPRWLAALRVHDAVRHGASQREIGGILYGQKSSTLSHDSGSDFLRLRVQRLVRIGRYMVSGGYLTLLR